MIRSVLPRRIQMTSYVLSNHKKVICKANIDNNIIIDTVIGIIALGVITDVSATLLKKKEPLEIIIPIVVEEDDKTNEDDIVIHADVD